MTQKKKKERVRGIQLVISVPQGYAVVKESLRKLAEENHRTLSNYVMMVLAEHVKNHMSGRIPGSGFGLND